MCVLRCDRVLVARESGHDIAIRGIPRLFLLWMEGWRVGTWIPSLFMCGGVDRDMLLSACLTKNFSSRLIVKVLHILPFRLHSIDVFTLLFSNAPSLHGNFRSSFIQSFQLPTNAIDALLAQLNGMKRRKTALEFSLHINLRTPSKQRQLLSRCRRSQRCDIAKPSKQKQLE